ncbi:hypothetical protein [Eleftheria terrae]|uniref:hypothetical protein n=1 Tax=Eleftheria terrae TaxID=1597781 RepID=UPI00263AD5D1|nr:hypothetical protein [Eleftheria terrae]WKB52293.1 hypothetical protein N7L95_21255 [Eleftheria terrae]
MKRRPPFTLVRDLHSHDTVKALEQLLEEARQGKVIGIAFAAMCRRRRFFVSAAGEAHRNPTFARGMVAALDDSLSQLLHAHS